METLQQKLANKIYELLPHKKELEFGCEVVKISKNLDKPDFVHGRFIRIDGMRMFCLKEDNTVFETKYADVSTSIIGQPLCLADLLMAIMKSSDYMRPKQKELFNLVTKFNLSKDNILDQSDELCRLGLELLS